MIAGEDHPAVVTLLSFFQEMKNWGYDMISFYNYIKGKPFDEGWLSRHRAKQRERLEAIYERFCETGLKAKRLRDTGMAFDGDSPEYDPDYQPIVAIEQRPGRVVIETNQINKLRWRFKYELVEVGAGWRIRDNKKRSSDKNPKWREDLL